VRTPPAPHRSLRTLVLTGSCAALLSSGCATIVQGRYQRVHVETYPPTATVSVTGTLRKTKGASLQFETPGDVLLHRKERHIILRIEKDGYEPAEVALRRKASVWTPIGATSFLGGVGAVAGVEGGAAAALAIGAYYAGISVGIDLATGSAYRLDPSNVSVTLQPMAGLSEREDVGLEDRSGSAGVDAAAVETGRGRPALR
jgi:hypothetical protein